MKQWRLRHHVLVEMISCSAFQQHGAATGARKWDTDGERESDLGKLGHGYYSQLFCARESVGMKQ
jgi:hypothetical protein